MPDRFRKKFLTPTPSAYSDRSSEKFRFRSARWFLRLLAVRSTDQVAAAAVVVTAVAAPAVDHPVVAVQAAAADHAEAAAATNVQL